MGMAFLIPDWRGRLLLAFSKPPFDPTDKLDCGLQREIPHA